MPKLMKKVVDATAPDPAGRDVFVWDADVKGFGLKVTATGRKVYVLQYRTPEGRSRRCNIGVHGSPWTCDEARGKAVDLLREIAAGNDPLDAKAEAKAAQTVKELAELYLAEGPSEKPNKKASSWKQDESQLRRHVVPLLGRKLAKALTQADIAKFQMDVANGKSAVDEKTGPRGRAIVEGGRTIAARCVAVLGAMLQFGVGRRLIASNPATGVKLLKGEKKERFLSDREVAALADALAVMEEERAVNSTMAAAIRLLMLTGCRKNEVLGLRWEWVDFDRGYLRLPDSKTGAKTVPLAAAALEILSGLERTSPYVLPASKGAGHVVGLQKAWEALRERATALARQRAAEAGEPVERAPVLSGVRLHDLRHSFASFAVADGATLFVVGKVLGHKQARTTEGYAHLADDPLRAVAERTGSKIADAIKTGTDRDRPKAEVVPLAAARKRKR
jgi:integrase